MSLNGQPAEPVPDLTSSANGMDSHTDAPAVQPTQEHVISNASLSREGAHTASIADTDEHAAIPVALQEAPEPPAPDGAGPGPAEALSRPEAVAAPPALTTTEAAARDTSSGALANVLIAAGTAAFVALIMLGSDRVLRNASTYFTVDIVIAVATGALLWGALVLLGRWERRRS